MTVTAKHHHRHTSLLECSPSFLFPIWRRFYDSVESGPFAGELVSYWRLVALSCLLTAAPANAQAATAPAASTAPAKKTIQAAQERLLALGYQPGAADGVMGAKGLPL